MHEQDSEEKDILFVIMVLMAMVLLLVTSGCSITQVGNKSTPSNTTFVYTYDKDGKPIASARVRDNVKLNVQIKDDVTGDLKDTQIDAGGWILVRPKQEAK